MVKREYIDDFYNGSLVLVYTDEDNYTDGVWWYNRDRSVIEWMCIDNNDYSLERRENSFTQDINRIIDERFAVFTSPEPYLRHMGICKYSKRYIR